MASDTVSQEAQALARNEEVRRLALQASYQVEGLCIMALAEMERVGSGESAIKAALVRIKDLNEALMSAADVPEEFDLSANHAMIHGTHRAEVQHG